jgi:hypothetical protein
MSTTWSPMRPIVRAALGASCWPASKPGARCLGCDVVALDSGTQRTAAHRFYFREGFVIPSFCFRKSLS